MDALAEQAYFLLILLSVFFEHDCKLSGSRIMTYALISARMLATWYRRSTADAAIQAGWLEFVFFKTVAPGAKTYFGPTRRSTPVDTPEPFTKIETRSLRNRTLTPLSLTLTLLLRTPYDPFHLFFRKSSDPYPSLFTLLSQRLSTWLVGQWQGCSCTLADCFSYLCRVVMRASVGLLSMCPCLCRLRGVMLWC
ncbi:hypothetical protein BCR34DRAFT_100586 [Clohesyomyces aquaticus]|uniref:Uncharacterized protein n=1 Tax=Clohesyomyces aquaticus TaxID=1231657 RepID=A0A1Y1YT31_9PLEO|nr:hypothetical protein BCR34DRAFT_100586 [Clohesyomyces aquaticus]